MGALNAYGYARIAAVNAAKTHCVKGHEFTLQNTYRKKNGTRDCRRCNADRVNALYHLGRLAPK